MVESFAIRPKARRHDPVRRGRRYNARTIRMQDGSGDQAATHEAAADGGALRWIPDARSRQVLRDAARDAPEPSCHTPKTPIGRRGVSLI